MKKSPLICSIFLLGKKFILSMLFVTLALQVSGQHRFRGLGANDSGGSSFKSIATNSVIVVSNNATGTTNGSVGSDLHSTSATLGGTTTIILKADGVYATSFDVNNLSISNYIDVSDTPANYTVNTKIVFKDAAGAIIRTMTLNATKSLPGIATSIGDFFDYNSPLPVTGVSSIEITINPSTVSVDAFTIEEISLSNIVSGAVPSGAATLNFNSLGFSEDAYLAKEAAFGPLNFYTNSPNANDLIMYNSIEGEGGTAALYDNNGDIGDITKWIISRHDGSEFALTSIYLKNSIFGSVGSFRAYKDGVQVGATVNSSFEGNQTLNSDFQDIDEFWIEGVDLNLFIDDVAYSIPSSSVSPTVLTTAASSIALTTATLAGNITADGGASVTERGIVYSITSTNSNPIISGTGVTKETNGTGTGVFSESITGLASGTQYSFKAYAINSVGIGYGTVQTFTAVACTDPTIPTITATASTICEGANTTLDWGGADLNDATNWHIYTTNCGAGQIASQAGASLVVSPMVTTTYNIRGEGGCVTAGSCGQVTVTVNALDDASFNYGAAAYCVDAVDPTPTITGLGGGTFSSTGGLSINASTGVINVSASSPSTYTVTYTTAGPCPNSSNVSIRLGEAVSITGATEVCLGSSITLTGNGTAATVDPWVSSNTGIATVDASGEVTGVSGGSTVITYTTDGGCSADVTVTVASITGATEVCAGSGIILTGNLTPASVDPWVSSNPAVATVSSTGEVTGVSGGSTVITYTTDGGCSTDYTVNTNPIIFLGTYPNTTVIAGQNTTVTPTAAPTGATTLNAFADAGFTGVLTTDPTTGEVTITDAMQAGVYQVTVTAPFGCGTNSFILTVTNPNCAATYDAAATDVSVGDGPRSFAIGDFNGDGMQDFATANQNDDDVSIRLGDGTGGFTSPTDVTVGDYPFSIAIGDFNGDGMQDFATANQLDNNVSIRLGDGAGGFTSPTDVTVGGYPISIAIGDFNGDGMQDFATTNFTGANVSIRLGTGTGVFTNVSDVSVGNNPFSIAIGDFNGDGNQDFATANKNDNDVSIRLGDGTGGFTSPTDVSVGVGPYSIAIGDFNGDGKQDFATANQNDDDVSIRLGDGTGGFTSTSDITVGSYPYSIAIADFNGDGMQDFATVNALDNDVSIRLGDGTGVFTSASDVSVGNTPASIAIGDFNGDGIQDFATANLFGDNIAIRLGEAVSITGATEVSVGSSITLTGNGTAATVDPWVSSNTGIATVDASGEVTGVSGGSTVITYTTDSGCTAQHTVKVDETVPNAPTVVSNYRCGPGMVSLSASGCSGTYNWFIAGIGGSPIGISSVFTTPLINETTMYYVACNEDNLLSSRVPVLAIINIAIIHSNETQVSGNYSSSATITSIAAVSSPTNYKAGASILLEPGFKTSGGTVFKAEIGPCEN
jgi:uncharacterized protein YjdB